MTLQHEGAWETLETLLQRLRLGTPHCPGCLVPLNQVREPGHSRHDPDCPLDGLWFDDERRANDLEPLG